MTVKFFIIVVYILQNKTRLFFFEFVYFIAKTIPYSKKIQKPPELYNM